MQNYNNGQFSVKHVSKRDRPFDRVEVKRTMDFEHLNRDENINMSSGHLGYQEFHIKFIRSTTLKFTIDAMNYSSPSLAPTVRDENINDDLVALLFMERYPDRHKWLINDPVYHTILYWDSALDYASLLVQVNMFLNIEEDDYAMFVLRFGAW